MNVGEQQVALRLEKEGWSVLRNGFPDFIVFKVVNGKVVWKGVEVKQFQERLREEQYKMKHFFARIGVPFEVMCPDKSSEEVLNWFVRYEEGLTEQDLETHGFGERKVPRNITLEKKLFAITA